MQKQGSTGGLVLLAGLAVLAITVWQISQAHQEASRVRIAQQNQLEHPLEEWPQLRGSATRQVQAAGLERFSRMGSGNVLRIRQARHSGTEQEDYLSLPSQGWSAMDVWDGDQQQSIESDWDLGQEDSQEAGPQGTIEFSQESNQLNSFDPAPQGRLKTKSLGLRLASEGSNITDADGLPEDFDWQAYLAYYPDLLHSGITSEAEAQQHYLEHGRQEGRIHKRLKVLLHYTACTGLINQHYSHIAAFTLSSAIGAELVLPPGLQRDSFASYFSMYKEQNEVTWTATSVSQLLDVDRIIEEWRAHGMEVHKVTDFIAPAASTCRYAFQESRPLLAPSLVMPFCKDQQNTSWAPS